MMQLQEKLAFGDDRALVHRSEADFLDHLQRAGRPFSNASFKERTRPVSKLHAVSIGGLTISAVAGTGIRLTSQPTRQLALIVPLASEGYFIQGRKTYAVRPGNQVISICYSSPLTVDYERFSNVNISPDPVQFEAELNLLDPGLRNPEAARADAGTIVSEGAIRGIDYHGVLRSMISMVDSASCNDGLLERIGLESLLTRLFAEVFLAQLGRAVARAAPGSRTDVKALDIICDHIAANVGKPLTIPQMEKLSGLSSRSVAYAFRSRFNCTPHEWQRNFLLDVAHRRLALGEASMAAIAADLGFSSLQRFRFYYQQRFGDAPRDRPS